MSRPTSSPRSWGTCSSRRHALQTPHIQLAAGASIGQVTLHCIDKIKEKYFLLYLAEVWLRLFKRSIASKSGKVFKYKDKYESYQKAPILSIFLDLKSLEILRTWEISPKLTLAIAKHQDSE